MLEIILANLPILVCFVLGIILLTVEVFMPGFGLPGISGIVFELVSIVLTYTRHGGMAALCVTLMRRRARGQKNRHRVQEFRSERSLPVFSLRHWLPELPLHPEKAAADPRFPSAAPYPRPAGTGG